MFVVRTEFAAPGVAPAAAVEGAQFCPLSLLTVGLRSSMDFPPPFAGVLQSQPPKVDSRKRVPQSPSLAYVTSSTFTKVPGVVPGFESVIFSPFPESDAPAVHGPSTPEIPYAACTCVGFAAMTRNPPAAIVVVGIV